ncbi:glycosyltransferase family 4 protein [Nostoc sp. LEGE 06077]|nr:glycosyltransferase family 4 protein [Nostoc sp. LEGE 06077]
MKVIFAPTVNDDNPYLSQLIANLQKINIQVETISSNSFFLSAVISHWKPDIVHFHWLDPLFQVPNRNKFKSILKLLSFIVQLIILKISGVKIVWTVHNLKNHENLNLFLDRISSFMVFRLAKAIITHCNAAKEEFLEVFSGTNTDKIFVIPHGNYVDSYENKIEKPIAREKLCLKQSGTIFLFLGLIRPYKGVFELIDTFKQLDNDEAQLVIAGKIYRDSPEIAEALIQKISDDKRIKLIPGFVPSEEVQFYMNACDIVIFPYRDVLTSGAVLLAMSFGKACIAPRKGCIGEALDDTGAFLYKIDDESGLIQAMKSALCKHSELSFMGQHNRYLAEKYNWKHVAEMTDDVYRSCL